MPMAHRSCFKPRPDGLIPAAGKSTLLSVGFLISLAGCNVSKSLDLETTGALKNTDDATVEMAQKATVPTHRAYKTVTVGKPVNVKATKAYGASPRISNRAEYNTPLLSARCREILALTGVETTILRSPTVSGEANDEGEVGASISYDIVDLRRANLKDDLALVKCKHSQAATKLAQLLLTSPQSLSRAGYMAKARSLRNSRSAFNRIEREIGNALQRGVLTIQIATGLRQHLNSVKSREADALGEASRREVVDGLQQQNFADLDQQLLKTERDAHRIERQLRTADAIKISLSGGYSVDTDTSNQILQNDGGAYAKVKVSMRLGAFRQQRYDFENEIGSARQDGYYEQYTGGFWKAGEIIRANRRALKALNQQKAQIRAAIKQANRNANRRSGEYEAEILAVVVRAKIDRLALGADLAGINATVADTKRVARKLRFQ